MQPLSLFSLFERHRKGPEAMPLPGQRLLHYLDTAGERLSELNKAFYQAIHGERFVHLKGVSDRYAILRGFRRRHIEGIFDQTGMQITWPVKVGYVKIEPSKESASYQESGSSGLFCIGFALEAKAYVGFKITFGSQREYEGQRLLKELPNLLCASDACYISESPQGMKLYQVMPIAGLRSVDKFAPYIRGVKDTSFQELVWAYLTVGLCIGLEAMHRQGVFHLDVKRANLVVNREGRAFLIDFGSARCGEEGGLVASQPEEQANKGPKNPSLFSAVFGLFGRKESGSSRNDATVPLIAPTGRQKISGVTSDGDERTYSPERWMACYGMGEWCEGEKVDGWAAGVLLFELVTGMEDFFDFMAIRHIGAVSGTHKGPEAIRRHFDTKLRTLPELQKAAPDSLWSLIKGLLSLDPKSRLSPSAALNHPWIKGKTGSLASQHEKLLSHLVELAQSRSLEQWNRLGESSDAFSPQQPPLPHFANYVRRPQLEMRLREQLLAKPFSVLQGMGGAGKSQLALYLFHSEVVRSHFGLRLWFRSCDQISSLETQIKVVASELGLVKEAAAPEEALRAFHRYLTKEEKPYLLVFDNADDPKLLEPYLFQGKGHILVTTRNNRWPDSMPVGVLTRQEATTLIATLIQKEDPDADRLAKTLGDLPLGLVQACAYIRNQALSLSAYLKLLKENESAIVRQNEALFGKDLPTSMGALWETTFRALELSCPQSLALLDTIAYLAPDNIPSSLLLRLGGGNWQSIDSLIQYSLLTRTGEHYSIHRLSQAIRRSKQGAEVQASSLAIAMQTFVATLLTDSTNKAQVRLLMPHGTSLGEQVVRQPLPDQPGTKKRLQRFHYGMAVGSSTLQQFKAMAFHSEQQLLLSNGLGDKAGEGTARGNLGIAFCRMGENRKAIPYLEENLKVAIGLKDLAGEGQALCNLGLAFDNIGEYPKARKCLERALEIARKRDDPVAQGNAYSGLGHVCQSLGEHRNAIAYYLQQVEIAYRLEDLSLEGRGYSSLGLAYDNINEWPRALEYHERALGIALALEDQLGEGAAYGNFGKTHQHMGDFGQAHQYHNKALEVFRRLEDKAGEGRAYCNLGLVCHSQGQYQKAIEYHEKDLEIAKRLGDPAGEGQAYVNLGLSYNSLGHYQKALQCYQEALKCFDHLEGIGEKGYAHTGLGDVYLKLKQPERAIECHGKALQMAVKLEDRRLEATAYGGLANAYQSQKKPQNAIEYYEKALKIMVQLGDPFAEGVIYGNLGGIYRQLGDHKRALGYHVRALEIANRIGDVDGQGTAYCNMAIAYITLGEFRKASEHCQNAYRILLPLVGEKHPSIIMIQKMWTFAQSQHRGSKN
ncbi:MAG: tetratricopeptide repeat protein [Parachlamydiales bacterium]